MCACGFYCTFWPVHSVAQNQPLEKAATARFARPFYQQLRLTTVWKAHHVECTHNFEFFFEKTINGAAHRGVITSQEALIMCDLRSSDITNYRTYCSPAYGQWVFDSACIGLSLKPMIPSRSRQSATCCSP